MRVTSQQIYQKIFTVSRQEQKEMSLETHRKRKEGSFSKFEQYF